MRSKWVKMDTASPGKNGKYWVYPYFSLEGSKYVTMARYENGGWEDKYQNQRFQYWQKVEVPDPPRLRE
jgi:hypothetical protein